jgi:electron transport complex protein RnfB
MLEAIMSLSGIGLTAAVALGLAAKKFAVETDPRELAILEALPGVNCGACGFAGCAGYAKALVAGEVDPNLCPPGGPDLVARLANILGVDVAIGEPQVAVVICQGDNVTAANKYHYLGLNDCVAAQRIADGPKLCPGGCIGLGSCERACPFDAIEITPDGLAVINREKCTGCRKCVNVCPRHVIRMAPRSKTLHVLCNSHDKGVLIRKYCQVGCIGCQVCVKVAPEVFQVTHFLATVDYEQEGDATAAIAKCPTRCIRDFDDSYPQGSSFVPPIARVRPDAA